MFPLDLAITPSLLLMLLQFRHEEGKKQNNLLSAPLTGSCKA
jgi:hypothetical protein